MSMAWMDVKKAYDWVDHKWFSSMMANHKFPSWIEACNTRIVQRRRMAWKRQRRSDLKEDYLRVMLCARDYLPYV